MNCISNKSAAGNDCLTENWDKSCEIGCGIEKRKMKSRGPDMGMWKQYPVQSHARTTTENNRGGKVNIKVCVCLYRTATVYFSLLIENSGLSSCSIFSLFYDYEWKVLSIKLLYLQTKTVFCMFVTFLFVRLQRDLTGIWDVVLLW